MSSLRQNLKGTYGDLVQHLPKTQIALEVVHDHVPLLATLMGRCISSGGFLWCAGVGKPPT